jgi:hypothetical protein
MKQVYRVYVKGTNSSQFEKKTNNKTTTTAIDTTNTF